MSPVTLKLVLAAGAGLGLFAQTGELAEVRVGSKTYEARPGLPRFRWIRQVRTASRWKAQLRALRLQAI
jgi:hypothetical protein